MERMLINATHDELRVALVNNGTLIDLDIEYPGSDQIKSNIYYGRISSIEPSLGAVFVDYGRERHGFLPLKEISKEYFRDSSMSMSDIDIRKAVSVNQKIVVQVEKEERGNKGAALTTFISLAGSYLVLMPNNPRGGGISRRIEGEQRDHLRDIIDNLKTPENMSVIIRTAGIDKSQEELEWDLKLQLNLWDAILQATGRAQETGLPHCLIHKESDVIIRAIRDYLRHNIHEIYVDEPSTFERAKKYISRVKPDFIDRIKLYNNSLPLFSCFQVEQQIEEAYQREINLPSGGSIVIDHTEALVSIDINSARSTKGGNIEETALNTNLEAANEIARQMRIRDIGGLIVIDFIDMLSNANQRQVEDRLRHALRHDRARIQTSRISRFGLLEMSRQRLNASLSRSTQNTCSKCEGRGSIRSIESLSLSIIRLIEERAVKAGGAQIQVQLPLDMCTFMINERGQSLYRIQQEHNVQVVVIPNEHLTTPHYIFKTIKDDHTKQTATYKLAKAPKPEQPSKRRTKRATTNEPFVNAFLDNSTALENPANKRGDNLIKRLWDTIFGINSDMGTSTTGSTQPSASARSAKSTEKPKSNNTRRAPSKTAQRPAKSNSSGSRSRGQGASESQANDRKAQQSKPRKKPATRRDDSNKSSPEAAKKKPVKAKTNTGNTKPAPSKKTATSRSSTQTEDKKPLAENKNVATASQKTDNAASKNTSASPRPAADKPTSKVAKSTTAPSASPEKSEPTKAEKPSGEKKATEKKVTEKKVTEKKATEKQPVDKAKSAPKAPATPASKVIIPTSQDTGLKQVKTRSAATKTAPVASAASEKVTTATNNKAPTPKKAAAATSAQQFSAEQYMPSSTDASKPKLQQVKTKKAPTEATQKPTETEGNRD